MRDERVRGVTPGARNGVYGPRLRGHARDYGRPTTPLPEVDLTGGTCASLPPAVVERYWHADGRNAFAVATARTMCLRCPVVEDCLTDALARPNAHRATVRAAMTGWDLAALVAERERSGDHPRKIARRELAHAVPPFRGAYGGEHMRKGQVWTPTPLTG